MNKSLVEGTTREKAFGIYTLVSDEFKLRVGRTKDKDIIKELWQMAYQKDKSEMKRVISAQAKKLGIELAGE